jgi:hypothetical protein
MGNSDDNNMFGNNGQLQIQTDDYESLSMKLTAALHNKKTCLATDLLVS